MYDEEYMDVVEQGPEGAENFDALEEDLLGVSAPAGEEDDETGVEESGKTGSDGEEDLSDEAMQGKKGRKRTGLLQKRRMKRKREREGKMTLPRRMLPVALMMQVRKAAKMSRLRKRGKGFP